VAGFQVTTSGRFWVIAKGYVMNAKTTPLKGSVTIATATEADEIVFHAKSFLKMVDEWIETAHPMMKG
jgi:hypothetical protein